MSVTEQAQAIAGHFDTDLHTVHHFSPDTIIKEMRFEKGFEVFSHAHSYDHYSVLMSGHVIVETDDSRDEYKDGAVILIKKGVHHRIVALENARWLCIHATAAAEAADIVYLGESK